MSPKSRMRQRKNVVLHMVMAFIIAMLLAQLWLFTVALEAMEGVDTSSGITLAALCCSLVLSAAVWTLTRFFLRSERRL